MSKTFRSVDRTVRRFANAVTGKGWKTDKERRQSKAARRQKQLDKIYSGAEMPDPEEIQRTERRKQAQRRGSRASTILTDRETLG